MISVFIRAFTSSRRIQEIFNEVSKTHRKIVIMGKQLQELINDAIDERVG